MLSHVTIHIFHLLCLIAHTVGFGSSAGPSSCLSAALPTTVEQGEKVERDFFPKFPYPLCQSSCHDCMHAWSTYQNGMECTG